jgi:hypothetical protein
MAPWIVRSLVATLLVLIAASAHAQAPGPPLNVTASVNANQTLTIRWTPPITGGLPTEYVVEMSIYPQPEYFFGAFRRRVPGNVTTFTTDWLRDRAYYIRVRAQNGDGNALSNQIAVSMPCLLAIGAENLSWRSLGDNRVHLVWTYEPLLFDMFLFESWHPTWRVEVGTAPGLADVLVGRGDENRSATLMLPSGTYYASVRATCHFEATGPLSEAMTIASGAASAPSPVLINEFAEGDDLDPRPSWRFVELKNVSSAPIAIGGWKVLVSDFRVSHAGTVPPGTTLQPGCTYLLGPADGVAGVPVDTTLSARPSDAALVTDTGQIADGVAAAAFSPLGEGTPLPRLPRGSSASYARSGGQDTNNNAADFTYVSSPTPQNSSSSCDASPGPPSALTSSVTGNTVTLWWNAPLTGGAPTRYHLEAGSVPGAANLAVFEVAASTRGIVFVSIPNGTYFVRVRAANAAGSSVASNELTVVVCGVGCTEPGPVALLAFQVSGGSVLLTWRAPTTGAMPTQYIVEAGSAPNLSNLAQFATGNTAEFIVVPGVPPGTYYVRIRAVSGRTIGTPSNEVMIAVP